MHLRFLPRREFFYILPAKLGKWRKNWNYYLSLIPPPQQDNNVCTQIYLCPRWQRKGQVLGNKTNPVSPYWQWMCCVHVPLPVVARLSVSKDLHLEVSHHGVHHFPETPEEHGDKPQPDIISYLTTFLVSKMKKNGLEVSWGDATQCLFSYILRLLDSLRF